MKKLLLKITSLLGLKKNKTSVDRAVKIYKGKFALVTSKAVTKKIIQSRSRTVTTRNSLQQNNRVISKSRRRKRTMRVITWCLMLMN